MKSPKRNLRNDHSERELERALPKVHCLPEVDLQITGRRFKRLWLKKACIGVHQACNPFAADALDQNFEGNLPDIHEQIEEEDDHDFFPYGEDDLEASEEQL